MFSTRERLLVNTRSLCWLPAMDLDIRRNLMAIKRKRNRRLTNKVDPMLFSLMVYNPHRVRNGSYRSCRFQLQYLGGSSDQSSGSTSNRSLSFKMDPNFYKPMAHIHFGSVNRVKGVQFVEARVFVIVESHEILEGSGCVSGYGFGYPS